jgi:hypothetical protein
MATAIGTYATLAAVKTRLGITNSTDDALLSTLCDQINQHIETVVGRVLAPVASAIYLFDGDGSRVLRVTAGIRAVTLLEIAPETGAAYVTIAAGEYFLRPLAQERQLGWPATKIVMSDRPSAGTAYSYFPRGLSTARVTMTTGWAVIPDDVAELAITATVRAWTARMAGQADVIGTDEYGKPIISRYLSGRDRDTLRDYSRELPGW